MGETHISKGLKTRYFWFLIFFININTECGKWYKTEIVPQTNKLIFWYVLHKYRNYNISHLPRVEPNIGPKQRSGCESY